MRTQDDIIREIKQYRIVVTLPIPVSYTRVCEFSPEIGKDSKGYYVKWGCWWPANFWFTTDGIGPNVGNHLYHAKQTALRKLSPRYREGATVEVVRITEDQ